MRKRKKAGFLAAVFLAAVVMTTGCSDSKLTTEQMVVPKEEEGQSENAAAVIYSNSENGIADQVQAPERYTADFSDGAVNVHVDAEVILPKSAGFKLYKVTGRPFSQEDYDAVSQVLLKNAPLWDRDYEAMAGSHGFTASEIKERIAQLKSQAEADGGLHQMAGDKNLEYAEVIADWENMLAAAPEEAVIVDVPAVVAYVKEGTGGSTDPEVNAESSGAGPDANWLAGYATVEGEDFSVSLNNDFQADWQWPIFSIRKTKGSIGDCYVNLEDGEKPESLVRDEIREKAVMLMNEMGFTDFAPAGEEYTQQLSTDADGETIAGAIGYSIHFTRTIDGIPVTYTHETSNITEKEEDVAWPFERMDMVFDESGITDFAWENPYVLEKQSDEYVFLMPFSDIKDIFEEMILEKYKWITKSGDVTFYFDIDEVRLGYMRIRDAAGAGEGSMIPVWDFMGSQTVVYTEAEEPYVNAGPYESWLTVNAMDGTIIDRSLGY